MKKKILSLVPVLALVLGLSACGVDDTTLSTEGRNIEAQAESIYSYCNSFTSDENAKEYFFETDKDLAQMKEILAAYYGISVESNEDLIRVLEGFGVSPEVPTAEEALASLDDVKTEDELEAYAEAFETANAVKSEGTVLISGVQSYIDALEELGTTNPIADLENIEVQAAKKEIFVYIPLKGTEHDAKMEIIFNNNYHVTSINTNIEYSFEELMVKAGTNTAFGMGTVFVMLIVIALIISLFGVFNKASKKSADKKKAAAPATGVDNAVKTIEAIEEAADNTALVAVIAAAIAAYEGSSSTDGFVVRSIKRIK